MFGTANLRQILTLFVKLTLYFWVESHCVKLPRERTDEWADARASHSVHINLLIAILNKRFSANSPAVAGRHRRRRRRLCSVVVVCHL